MYFATSLAAFSSELHKSHFPASLSLWYALLDGIWVVFNWFYWLKLLPVCKHLLIAACSHWSQWIKRINMAKNWKEWERQHKTFKYKWEENRNLIFLVMLCLKPLKKNNYHCTALGEFFLCFSSKIFVYNQCKLKNIIHCWIASDDTCKEKNRDVL